MKTRNDKLHILTSTGTLLILALLGMTGVTYAWLGVSRVPFVSDVSVSVIMENALMIAPDENGQAPAADSDLWAGSLDASSQLEGLVPLQPVTYTGDETFCRVRYDDTGRAGDLVPLEEENFNVTVSSNASAEARVAAEQKGYMVRIPFWMKCAGSYARVSLTEAEETAEGQMGYGTYAVSIPKWNSAASAHYDGGNGSEATLRMGFACTHTDLEGNPTGETEFFIYEPNADIHLDGQSSYRATNAVAGGLLIDEDHHIIQNASTWKEASPVSEDGVVYTPGTFTQNHELFDLGPDEMMQVTLYIWMEGQDEDCIAKGVAQKVTIASNIQFGVEAQQVDTGVTRNSALTAETESTDQEN